MFTISSLLSHCLLENTKTYQQLLVKALHQCGVKFPITAEIVVPILMDFLAEGNEVGTLSLSLSLSNSTR